MNKELVVVKIREPIMEAIERRCKELDTEPHKYIEGLIEKEVLNEKW